MGWIDVNDKLPPEGLQVLLEVSGRYTGRGNIVADHGFFIGTYIVPESADPGWIIDDASTESDGHILYPEVHAWMPLPKHFAKQELFTQEEDMMEHAMFEDDPEWLYKDDAVYEQMTMEEFIQESRRQKCL